jgi:hypothetical protein
MTDTAVIEHRFFAVGADVHDRQRPGIIAGFGRAPGKGTSAQEAADLLNNGHLAPDYYQWWPAAQA